MMNNKFEYKFRKYEHKIQRLSESCPKNISKVFIVLLTRIPRMFDSKINILIFKTIFNKWTIPGGKIEDHNKSCIDLLNERFIKQAGICLPRLNIEDEYVENGTKIYIVNFRYSSKFNAKYFTPTFEYLDAMFVPIEDFIGRMVMDTSNDNLVEYIKNILYKMNNRHMFDRFIDFEK